MDLKPCPFCGDTSPFGNENCVCGNAETLRMTRKDWNTRPIEEGLQNRITALESYRDEANAEREAARVKYAELENLAVTQSDNIKKHTKSIMELNSRYAALWQENDQLKAELAYAQPELQKLRIEIKRLREALEKHEVKS